MLALPLLGVWSGPNGLCDLGLVISSQNLLLFHLKMGTQEQLPPYQDCKLGPVCFLGSSPCQPIRLPFLSCSPLPFLLLLCSGS